ITSSVAMGQPIIAFLEDEFKISRKRAILGLAFVILISVQFIVFFLKYGYLDEFDYWGGTFGLAAFALLETILFMWVFGADKAWKEINEGADIKIPFIFYYIMKYVTPLSLMILLTWWFINDAIPILALKNMPAENIPYIWGARILMVTLAVGFLLLVKAAWKKRRLNEI
ncbi:MAG TPA: sodium:calcium symporter, partial [Ignavibacteriales bacterium]|nr:sodium:calcium symporter [Ignavibacteriales bacterium]